jgi:hypothetical protein
MDGGNDILSVIAELAKVSPTAFGALLASAPAIGSIWIVFRILKGRDGTEKEPDEDKVLAELKELHATVKAGFAAVGQAQAASLLETVRQGAKE